MILYETIGFIPDTAGWKALYINKDGKSKTYPIVGWLIQKSREYDSDTGELLEVQSKDTHTRVVPADFSGNEVEVIVDRADFNTLIAPEDVYV